MGLIARYAASYHNRCGPSDRRGPDIIKLGYDQEEESVNQTVDMILYRLVLTSVSSHDLTFTNSFSDKKNK